MEKIYYHISENPNLIAHPYLHAGSKSSAIIRGEHLKYENPFYYTVKVLPNAKIVKTSDMVANIIHSKHKGFVINKSNDFEVGVVLNENKKKVNWNDFSEDDINRKRNAGEFYINVDEETMSGIKAIENSSADIIIYDNEIEGGQSIMVVNPKAIELGSQTNEAKKEKGNTKFMQWYFDWYIKISDKINITFSLPNALQPFKEENVVVLDLFEKIDQNIDAKPYFKEIVQKADDYGVTIYLEPMPRYKYFVNNIEKRKKISKDYLISYYQKFGFEITSDKNFMKRLPKSTVEKYHLIYESGGETNKAIMKELRSTDVKTGEPISFYYSHAKNKQKTPNFGAKYGQNIEPHGKYIISVSESYGKLEDNDRTSYEYGIITFKNPLVLEHKSTDDKGWKKDLMDMFGGKKGSALSKEIIKKGYDGIITTDGSYVSEIVALNEFKMENGGEINEATEGFDWMSLFDKSPEKERQINEQIEKSEEQEREEWYQGTSFSKKWAATYQEAVNKTVKEYFDAKATYEDWGSRQYKSNKGVVYSGGDDIHGTAYTIGGINEYRRKKTMDGAKMQMDEAIETLKELQLSDNEIADLLKNKLEQGGEIPTSENKKELEKMEEDTVVLNEGNGVIVNEIYKEWSNITSPNDWNDWAFKVRSLKFGTYKTIGFLEVLEEFNFKDAKINDVLKNDFLKEVKQALNYGKMIEIEEEKKPKMEEKEQLIWFTEEALEFVPEHQLPVIKGAKREYQDAIYIINKAVKDMPTTYSTEGIEDKKVYLHYFSPSADWHIVEKDMSASVDGHLQDFGYADLGYGAELGYISINELKSIKAVNLDLYFEPVRWSSLSGESVNTDINAYKNPYELNRAIEKLIDSRGDERNAYDSKDIEFISYYSGYGGLEKFGSFPDDELKRLKYEYFTPDEVCKKMWALAYKYGYGTVGDSSVFEPSVGTGNFLKYAPKNVIVGANEINKYSAIICQILHPNVELDLISFERNFIKNNLSIKAKTDSLKKYSLVIGNPPYGALGGLYITRGEDSYSNASNWTEYFIFRGLDLLHKDGLLIFVVGAEQYNGATMFLDGKNSKIKGKIAEKADLIDAYRLPTNIFERTGVSSEIVIFKKK
jgi:hypothetical protein